MSDNEKGSFSDLEEEVEMLQKSVGNLQKRLRKRTLTIERVKDLNKAIVGALNEEDDEEEVVEVIPMKRQHLHANAVTIENKFFALIIAIKEGYTTAVKQCLIEGADPTYKNGIGRNALHYAAESGHLLALKELLICTNRGYQWNESSPHINVKDNKGDTPLFLAASAGHSHCVRVLLAANADINAQNKWFDTPLHRAARYRHMECTKVLIESGANPHLLNHQGQKPSQQTTDSEIKALLEQYEMKY